MVTKKMKIDVMRKVSDLAFQNEVRQDLIKRLEKAIKVKPIKMELELSPAILFPYSFDIMYINPTQELIDAIINSLKNDIMENNKKIKSMTSMDLESTENIRTLMEKYGDGISLKELLTILDNEKKNKEGNNEC